MRLFVVVLALAVTASTQAMAFEPLHDRHIRITRNAEVNDGSPAHRHRGVSGACVLNPDNGPHAWNLLDRPWWREALIPNSAKVYLKTVVCGDDRKLGVRFGI